MSAQPTPRVTRAFYWLLWHLVLDFGLEKLVALAALGWGLSVTAFQPLRTTPGWHYLLWMVSWQTLPADMIWGPLLLLFGTRQFSLACQPWSLLTRRADAALLTGCIFCFFAVALALGQPGGTGVPVYAVLAWAGFVSSYQLAQRERSRRAP